MLRTDMNQPSLMTIKEAARYARVGRVRIDNAIAGGELRFVELGTNTRRIRLEDMEKWIASKVKKQTKI
jgi:excisionase family DNA binding protein